MLQAFSSPEPVGGCPPSTGEYQVALIDNQLHRALAVVAQSLEVPMREIVKNLIKRLGKNEDVPDPANLNLSRNDPSLASTTSAAGLADALSPSRISIEGSCRANDAKQGVPASAAHSPTETAGPVPSGDLSASSEPKLPVAAAQPTTHRSLAADEATSVNGALSPAESTTLAVSRHCPPVLKRSTWNVTDFDLRALLYNGNISMVYHAIDKRSGITVALKLYKRAKLTAIERHQVAREIKLHINLNHASIIAMYAAWKDKQYVYLALEWAPGGDVYSYLRANGQRLTEDLAVHLIMEPFLEGLLLLHTQGLIHRDIKPENILLTRALQVKIADFGLSIDSKHEIANTRLGTVDYLAPEILECPIKHSPQDNKDNPRIGYTNKVDCWSVGVLAYELLTGQPPFAAGTPQETLRNIRTKPIEWPPWLSKESLDFMRLALVRDPTRRLSISQMLEHPWIRRYSRHSRPVPHASGVNDMVSRRNSVPASLISSSLRSLALEAGGMGHTNSLTPTAAYSGNTMVSGMPGLAVYAAAARSQEGTPHSAQHPVASLKAQAHAGGVMEDNSPQTVAGVGGHGVWVQGGTRSLAGNSPGHPGVAHHHAAAEHTPGHHPAAQVPGSQQAEQHHMQPAPDFPGAQGRIAKFMSLGPSHHSYSHSTAGAVVARIGGMAGHPPGPSADPSPTCDGLASESPAGPVKQLVAAPRKPEALTVATSSGGNNSGSWMPSHSTPQSPSSSGRLKSSVEVSSPVMKSLNGGSTPGTAGQVHLPPIDLHKSFSRSHAADSAGV